MQEEHLVNCIMQWLANSPQLNTASPSALKEDTDLIGSGLLDSLGFIELLVYVESVTGEKIDLSDLAPSDFTTIRGLVKSVLHHEKETSGTVTTK